LALEALKGSMHLQVHPSDRKVLKISAESMMVKETRFPKDILTKILPFEAKFFFTTSFLVKIEKVRRHAEIVLQVSFELLYLLIFCTRVKAFLKKSLWALSF